MNPMYKKLLILLLVVFLVSCEPEEQEIILLEKGSVDQGGISLFPKSSYGYIGDPMPFYDEGVMNMFYLLDERGGTIGFHPFALLQTTDYLTWTDHGTVIPYVNSISSQDLALGTGSVMKDKDGLYHAFYTGHNSRGEMPYFEKIQHATSTDLVNWTKHPEDGFFGGVNDFRDPYIYYDEASDAYWMLITTRDYIGGVIKRYISTDLINWTNAGVFYRNTEGNYNMECPTLIYVNGYYYLSFSAQGTGNQRVVHYRYTESLEDGFTIPDQDFFDGWGFYAGRIERMEDRLILTGWVATKTLDRDFGNYMWGGHLVTHELIQAEDGTLHPKLLTELDEKLSNEVEYTVIDTNLSGSTDDFLFTEKQGYGYALFDELLEKPTKMTFKVDLTDTKNFGLTYNAFESSFGNLNVYFDLENQMIEFYRVNSNLIKQSDSEIRIPFNFGGLSTLEIKVVTEGTVIVVYVNEEIALTSRAYDMAGSSFGFFSLGSKALIYDIHFYE
ncbi:MAG TPA: glycoside hydrolase family 32 [Acholeplasmataceae bacterium]|nr:glycoside hydrolase family 32 [Acholeplasmataceae bacterium]HBY65388.1 glycoside hydrolase family 32 [Acholeplasmataceae bacterium]